MSPAAANPYAAFDPPPQTAPQPQATPAAPAASGTSAANPYAAFDPAPSSAVPSSAAPEPDLSARREAFSRADRTLQWELMNTTQRGKYLKVQQDKGIDYNDSSVPFAVRSAVKGADNSDEARLALQRYYRPEQISQDSNGAWVVKDLKTGKRSAVLPGGFQNDMEDFAAGIASAPGTEIGSALGAAAGTAIEPGGGTAIGAATGGALGKGVDDLIKKTEGTFHQTVGEVLTNMGFSAAASALPEAGGMAARGIRRTVHSLAGVTPEVRHLTERSLEIGAVPPSESYAGDLKINQTHSRFGREVFGNLNKDRNQKALKHEASSIMTGFGFDKDAIDTVLSGGTNSHAAAAQKLVEAVQTREATYKKEFDVAKGKLQGLFDKTVAGAKQPGRIAGNTEGDKLGTAVAENLIDNRVRGAEIFDDAYKLLDTRSGGAKVVNIPKDFAKTKALPTSEGASGKWTLMEAQRERATLEAQYRKSLNSGGLTPGISSHGTLDTIKQITANMDAAADDPHVGHLVGDLKDINRSYRQASAQWRIDTANKIVKDLRQDDRTVSPAAVADMIFDDPKNMQKIQGVWGMLRPEVKQNITRAHFEGLLQKAVTFDPEAGTAGSHILDKKKFVKLVSENEPFISKFYSKEDAYQARYMATMANSIDHPVMLNHLGAGQFKTYLGDMVRADQNIEQMMKSTPLKTLLRDNDPAVVDTVMKKLTTPRQPAQLTSLMQQFGEHSPEMQSIRKYALDRIFDGMFERLPTGKTRMNGEKLLEEFNKYTPEEKRMLFPADAAPRIEDIGKLATFLSPWPGGELPPTFRGIAAKMALGPHLLLVPGLGITNYVLPMTWHITFTRPWFPRFFIREAGQMSQTQKMTFFRGSLRLMTQQQGVGPGDEYDKKTLREMAAAVKNGSYADQGQE